MNLKILGIYIGACSGASIFENDKIIFATSEERFSRIKADEAYPKKSIDNALEFSQISSNDLDAIVIAGNEIALTYMLTKVFSGFSINDYQFAMKEFWRPKLSSKSNPLFLDLFKSKIISDQFPFTDEKINEIIKFEHGDWPSTYTDYIKQFFTDALVTHLGVDKNKIHFLDHHQCHAAYALYSSPIRDNNTLIFTADAHGDGLSGTISKFDKDTNKIIRLKKYFPKNFQLGRIYRYTTLLLRMLPEHHEYKVMGLAPYYDGPLIEEVVKIFENMQTIDGLEFKFNSDIKNIYDYLEENLSKYRFDHIAAGLQSFTENLLYSWISAASSSFDSTSIVFSGGISMNVKANMKLSQIPNIKKFFVSGGGSDQSLCMGACYLYAESQKIFPKPLNDLYLGLPCTYDDYDIKKIQNKYKIEKFTHVEQIVERLLDGKIIATCIGRSEMGPRALCNRSIIADPRNRNNIEKINRKIKNRDFWMPFAPVIIADYSDKLLVNPKNLQSPHMTIAMDTLDGKNVIPAAVHQYDGTARPLILEKNTNSLVWDVINSFYQKTDIPALVNTSFNLHGEPMVDSFNDALHVFENSGLDSLWIDNHIIDKK